METAISLLWGREGEKVTTCLVGGEDWGHRALVGYTTSNLKQKLGLGEEAGEWRARRNRAAKAKHRDRPPPRVDKDRAEAFEGAVTTRLEVKEGVVRRGIQDSLNALELMASCWG